MDIFGNIFQPRLESGAVGENFYIDFSRFFRLQIEQVKPAAIFKHDFFLAVAREMNVELFEKRYLAKLLLLRVVSPDVRAFVFVAIRKKIKRCAVPHRLRVGGIIMRDVFGFQRIEIEKPNIGIHAAAVAFPGGKIDADGRVSQRLAVR